MKRDCARGPNDLSAGSGRSAPAWAHGPTADGRAANSARRGAPLRPLGPKASPIRTGAISAVHADRTAGRCSRRNKTVWRPVPHPNPNHFALLPRFFRARPAALWAEETTGAAVTPFAGARALPCGSAPPSSGLAVKPFPEHPRVRSPALCRSPTSGGVGPSRAPAYRRHGCP